MIERIKDLPIEEYHGANERVISSSRISDFLESPLKYKRKHIDKKMKKEDTKAIKIGNMVDGMYFEDKVYSTKTKTEANYLDIANCCIEAMKEHHVHGILKDGGAITQDTFRTQIDGGITVQCRPDLLVEEIGEELGDYIKNEFGIECQGDTLLLDGKTTGKISDWRQTKWYSPFVKWGYYRQTGLYQTFLRDYFKKKPDEIGVHCLLWVVETQEPYDTVLLHVPHEIAVMGGNKAQEAISKIKLHLDGTIPWHGQFGPSQTGAIEMDEHLFNELKHKSL